MPHRSSTPSPPPPPSWTIQPVPPHSFEEVVQFINTARNGMFPGRSLSPDNASLFKEGTCFLEARDGKNLIAAIGYVPYNHRFPQFFNFYDVNTVEVVRLFVHPRYRRCGLAAALFTALYDEAVNADVERFYLHTHPFLDGAIKFWEKCGFEIILLEDDPYWETTHMQLMVKRREEL
ncbi:hypothetical protein HBI12_054140 [Parastagonospora nodorum]|nr:hypothetical protein HBI12_054140 [Parastagonospora nodorum]KAH5433631.1 hypothetical protein HBI47_087460 [Parastagonospora nodorum]